MKTDHRLVFWLSDSPDGADEINDEFLRDAVPVYRTVFGQVEGLPEPAEGTVYIVSGMVAAACRGRDDVVCAAAGHPGTVRRDGQVWSVPGFSRG